MAKKNNYELKNEKNKIKKELKAKKQRRNAIISISATILVLVIVAGSIILINVLDPIKKVSGNWKPYKALMTETGEEIDLAEVYNTVYTNFSGSLILNDDKTFSYFMTVGEDTGNRSGTYTVDINEKRIYTVFENEDKKTFSFLSGNDGKVSEITGFYGEYTIKFYREDDSYFSTTIDPYAHLK